MSYTTDAGFNGGQPANMLLVGWLSDPKPGNIWWLMWKSRWYIASGV